MPRFVLSSAILAFSTAALFASFCSVISRVMRFMSEKSARPRVYSDDSDDTIASSSCARACCVCVIGVSVAPCGEGALRYNETRVHGKDCAIAALYLAVLADHGVLSDVCHLVKHPAQLLRAHRQCSAEEKVEWNVGATRPQLKNAHTTIERDLPKLLLDKSIFAAALVAAGGIDLHRRLAPCGNQERALAFPSSHSFPVSLPFPPSFCTVPVCNSQGFISCPGSIRNVM